MLEIRITPAAENDTPVILEMIRELADYEKLTSLVSATEERLRQTLFGPRPAAEVLLARCHDAGTSETTVGFALFFQNYSTFLAQPGIYLEDLYVKPHARGKGAGLALLAELAAIAVARGCGRVEWAVLNWNEPSIGFYKRLGALPMDDWTTYRLAGEALPQLAARRIVSPDRHNLDL